MKVIIVILLCLLSTTLLAVDIDSVKQSEVDVSRSNEELADYWGLSVAQYDKYLNYMEKEGKYHYNHLDPVFVSGLIAENERDRQQLAQLYYRQELKRHENLQRFDNLFREYGRASRGDNPLVSVDKLSQLYNRDIRQWRSPAIQPLSGDRITFFVSPDCGSACNTQFTYFINEIGDKFPVSTVIDVFFIDHSRQEIERWAQSVNLDPGVVKAGTVTLNFDDRYESVFGSPDLPAAFLVRNKQVLGQL